ncbi:MAG: methyltransferase domain-containing protein [Flavobacteriales bacterium]|nr:methyltransferase domain-containing protein [Flavobacteriales bacterium]
MNRIRHEIIFYLISLKVKYHLKRSAYYEVELPRRKVRRILKKHDLYYDKKGNPSWWFKSFMNRRNSIDELTQGFFNYMTENISKDANILITGCGSGWMLIWFAQHGYKNLSGFDYLKQVVGSAIDLNKLAKIEVKIWEDDGFEPSDKLEQYDVITALYWLYSAWGGTYGNKSRADQDNQELLKQFISNYLPHLSDNGYIFIELIDSIADFQEPPVHSYPIRHSMDQVAACADELGLTIVKKMFNGRHRKEPKMLYIMQKVA